MRNNANHIIPFDKEALGDRSIKGAAVTSAAQGVKFLLLLASQIVLVRLLSPADFGIVAMASPVFGLVAVLADLGLLQAIVQRPVVTHGQLNALFWINLLLSSVLAMALVLAAPLLAAFYVEPRLTAVVLALASLVVVSGPTSQQNALLNRTMRFSALALSETLSLAVGFAVGVLSAESGLGYWSLVLAQMANTMTTAVVVWTASSWRPSAPRMHPDVVSMLHFGGNITVFNLAGFLNQTLDNMLVGYFLGEVSLGLYDRAWKLAVTPLGQLMAPIGRVAIPALSRVSGDADRYRKAFAQMTQTLLIVSTPGLAVAILAAEPIIVLFFGERWRELAPVFSWLCVGGLITPVNISVFWILISQGRARDQMIFGTAASLINLASYACGIQWGIVGVARTSAISVYLLQTPLLLWAATRSGPVNRSTMLAILLPLAVANLAVLATVTLCHSASLDRGFGGVAVTTVLAYVVEFFALSCSSSGRKTLKNFGIIRQALRQSKRGSVTSST